MTSPPDARPTGARRGLAGQTFPIATTPGASAPACANCARRVEIRDPEWIVCVAHLEFRRRTGGGDCPHYLAARPSPEPPQLDTGPRPAETPPS